MSQLRRCTFLVQAQKDPYKDNGNGHSPSEHQVLVLGQQPVLLDDEGHDGVDVQTLQEHEHEAGREEEVDQD